ncbi:hypothetical protein CERZMDRAFT_86567 [Cercospora zeae-maydis SCOH1-5]|uniref:Uncharacterized protein n=1 Tax=Cercospora zeae-maydis SCOH1-5 TaxID=717836 RepID=A0A6A6F961_9PEZI|nr:hypothetical protein CERZMDRAFT_86567 [Cercospora zeae-maydis SCOH1-5]
MIIPTRKCFLLLPLLPFATCDSKFCSTVRAALVPSIINGNRDEDAKFCNNHHRGYVDFYGDRNQRGFHKYYHERNNNGHPVSSPRTKAQRETHFPGSDTACSTVAAATNKRVRRGPKDDDDDRNVLHSAMNRPPPCPAGSSKISSACSCLSLQRKTATVTSVVHSTATATTTTTTTTTTVVTETVTSPEATAFVGPDYCTKSTSTVFGVADQETRLEMFYPDARLQRLVNADPNAIPFLYRRGTLRDGFNEEFLYMADATSGGQVTLAATAPAGGRQLQCDLTPVRDFPITCYNILGQAMVWYRLAMDPAYLHLGLAVPAGATPAQALVG